MFTDSEKVDTLALERLKLVAMAEFSKELIYPQGVKIDFEEHKSFMLDSSVLRMVAEFVGKLEHDEIVKYPANWKESLKER